MDRGPRKRASFFVVVIGGGDNGEYAGKRGTACGDCNSEYAGKHGIRYHDWHTGPRNSGLPVDESRRRCCDDRGWFLQRRGAFMAFVCASRYVVPGLPACSPLPFDEPARPPGVPLSTRVVSPPDPPCRARRVAARAHAAGAVRRAARQRAARLPRLFVRHLDAEARLAWRWTWRDAECGRAAARAVGAGLGERRRLGDAGLDADPLSGVVAGGGAGGAADAGAGGGGYSGRAGAGVRGEWGGEGAGGEGAGVAGGLSPLTPTPLGSSADSPADHLARSGPSPPAPHSPNTSNPALRPTAT